MMKGVMQALHWMVSLGGKFARVVPLQTISIVCLTLASQISSLLASFLPLKVVILLGSEQTPRYFPDSWVALDKDVLIALLCLGTLGFYLLHLLAERVIRAITVLGTQRLLERSHKMALFEGQDELAQDAYLRFSRALAGSVFIALALAGLGFFYPVMAVVLLGYLLLAGLLLWLLHVVSKGFRVKLEQALSSVLAVVAGFGFFVGFAYLVADFIFWIPPGVIIGIVALLLSRQVMQRMAGMVADLASLQRQQVKLDALFFHGKVFLPALPNDKGEFWNLLAAAHRHVWVAALLREFTPWQEGPLEIQWQQSGVADIAAFLVQTDTGLFLVKLYDRNRRTFALHESTLLLEKLPGLPALTLLGVSQVAGLHCLLYSMPEGEFVAIRGGKKKQKPLLTALMRVKPSEALRQRYMRSRPLLWQRLRAPALERMRVAVVDGSQEALLDALLRNLSRINSLLQELPLWISTPDIGPANIYQPTDSAPVLLNWNRWFMEPVGAGWPIVRMEELAELLLQMQTIRRDLMGLTVCHLELAALGAALETACNAQRYSEAIDLVPTLLTRLEVVNASDCA